MDLEICPLCKKAVIVCMCVAVVGGSALPEANSVATINPQPELSQPFRPPEQHNHQDEATGPQPDKLGAVQVSTSTTGSLGTATWTTPGRPPPST
jgi:hypothetical protein